MNPDPVEDLFDGLTWFITKGDTLDNITYFDENELVFVRIYKDPTLLQRFLVPLTSQPIIICYTDEQGNDYRIQYPAGMTGLHILGAINTFYTRPYSQETIDHIMQNPNEYPGDYQMIQSGRIPTIKDALADSDKQTFVGLRKYKDCYVPDFE